MKEPSGNCAPPNNASRYAISNTEQFVKGTVPGACEGHKVAEICTESECIANEYCTNVETRTYTARPEKEDTTLWKTENNSMYDVPTDVCTIHQKTITKMINVVGLKKDDASKKIKDIGLNVTVETKESEKEAGIVISQSKAEGTEVSEGDTITIVVSKGKDKTNTITNTTNTIDTNTTNTSTNTTTNENKITNKESTNTTTNENTTD